MRCALRMDHPPGQGTPTSRTLASLGSCSALVVRILYAHGRRSVLIEPKFLNFGIIIIGRVRLLPRPARAAAAFLIG